ncbi:MAG: SpoIIE family protein phosphatase [Bacteroidales bacterium]|nr:SpoIIE family protein phosphatase [Bacteroidales bacterium]
MDTTRFGLTFWGLFRNHETEKEYIQKIVPDVLAHNSTTILVAGLGYWAVSAADFAKLGLSAGFYQSVLARTIFLALCLFSYFLIKRIGTYKATVTLASVITLCSSVLIITVIYILNPDKTIDTIDQITVPVVTLLIYTFMQIPLLLLFVNGLMVTVLYILLIILFMKDTADTTINIVAILVVINFMGVYFNRFLNSSRRREYANQATIEYLNDDLRQEIEERKTTQQNLENALEQITDSIKYAQKIQFALLPSETILQQNFKESTILFQPRNIVSGDFYWVHKIEEKIIVAVADCTGHGIPGAFMSVLGISLLNDITRSSACDNDKPVSASTILDKLRELVINSLNKGGEDTDRRDGMDISLIIIDKQNKTIRFSGAYNPLWLIREQDGKPILSEYIGDRMPIGIHTKKASPFTEKVIPYENNDIVYLFTDGYKDQFGGTEGKKILSKQFREILFSVYNKPLELQRTVLVERFDAWKGNYGQVDDVLVMALKL